MYIYIYIYIYVDSCSVESLIGVRSCTRATLFPSSEATTMEGSEMSPSDFRSFDEEIHVQCNKINHQRVARKLEAKKVLIPERR